MIRMTAPAAAPILNMTREGGGPALILIHGVAGSRRIWDNLAPLLAPHFEVVRLDLLGYGHSPKPATGYTPAGHVEAIRATLAAQGLKPPYRLVGLSMGCLLVLEFAQRYPTEVKQVACIGLPYHRSPAEATRYLSGSFWAGLALKGGAFGHIAITGGWWVGRHLPWLVGRFTNFYTPAMTLESIMASYRAFYDSLTNCMVHNRPEPLLAATVATPQAYLFGSRDRWIDLPAAQAALSAHPNCHVTILPGAEHNTAVTAPVATVAWLRQAMAA